MRISDWSSDVCSSDLATGAERYAAMEQLWGAGGSAAQSYAAMVATARAAAALSPRTDTGGDPWQLLGSMLAGGYDANAPPWVPSVSEIGRASGREKGVQYGLILVVAGPLNHKL